MIGLIAGYRLGLFAYVLEKPSEFQLSRARESNAGKRQRQASAVLWRLRTGLVAKLGLGVARCALARSRARA